jgi:hypothetical protein
MTLHSGYTLCIPRADLLARLKSHCASLRPILMQGAIEPEPWRAAHDNLLTRARDAEVIAALGPRYDAFMKVIHDE